MVRNTHEILNQKFVLKEFSKDLDPLGGQYEFPFLLTVPEWLEPSIMCQFESTNNLSRTYYMQAQIEPENQEFIVEESQQISSLRCDCAIYLYKSIINEETKDQDLSG